MNIFEYIPNSLIIPNEINLRRKNARADEFIDPTYNEKYDNTSVFYDVFNNGEKIYLIGPPLLNLEPILDCCYAIDSSNNEAKVNVKSLALERTQLSYIELSQLDFIPVLLKFDLSQLTDKEHIFLTVKVGENMNHYFKDSKSLMTLQLNNKLEWIKDWGIFYNKVHNVDTVVVYDNKSTDYSINDIIDSLSQVNHLKNVVVVSWNFKYGPQGKPWTGPNTPWDSDFCQIGALQHMRFRFSLESKGFINADIDELIIPLDDTDLFETLENSELGVVGIEGNTIEGKKSNFAMSSEGVPHFYHFWERKVNITGGTRKWAGAPRKWDDYSMQATAHWVRGINYKADPRFSIGHFRQINDGWKIQSRTEDYKGADKLRTDYALLSALYNSFPEAFSKEVLVSELKIAEKLISERTTSGINFQQGLRSGITLVTERVIPWIKNWVWRDNVLVFEVSSEYGTIAFDIVNTTEYIQLNLSIRDTKFFKEFAEKVLEKDFSVKLLGNQKGFIINKRNRKDFKTFEDAVRYFSQLIIEWYKAI
ncbi:capZD protein [Actinobacillus equuli]|uniref:capZD protein n=1 Tax=Actinobacillus equuli TaxID=718 RepID=UPI0024426DE9|nr:capZD protein [Actinobacillus equuli]WGE52753.1 capZD protein [Actinobacillus equuli subsp. haemolyticus]WGE73196.1 capZD protein [Actinobacillus equuli subsp. haemolyticus]